MEQHTDISSGSPVASLQPATRSRALSQPQGKPVALRFYHDWEVGKVQVVDFPIAMLVIDDKAGLRTNLLQYLVHTSRPLGAIAHRLDVKMSSDLTLGGLGLLGAAVRVTFDQTAAGDTIAEGAKRPLRLVQQAIYDGGRAGSASSGWRPAAQPAGKPGFTTLSPVGHKQLAVLNSKPSKPLRVLSPQHLTALKQALVVSYLRVPNAVMSPD